MRAVVWFLFVVFCCVRVCLLVCVCLCVLVISVNMSVCFVCDLASHVVCFFCAYVCLRSCVFFVWFVAHCLMLPFLLCFVVLVCWCECVLV